MVPDLVLRPSPVLLWLSTGTRRLSLRRLRLIVASGAFLFLMGPADITVPSVSPDVGNALPAPLVGSGLHPAPISVPAAERLLGEPLLDSALLRQGTQDLGVWAAALNGPYGHTVVVFRVLSTSRQTWLTILELRSERSLEASPWELVVSRPITINGRPATLYQQPGSTTVAWQEGPTLETSISEDVKDPRLMRRAQGAPGAPDPSLLSEAQFVRLAASLQPRGVQVGPFRLDTPW